MGYFFDRDFDREIELEQAEATRLAHARYTEEELREAVEIARLEGRAQGHAEGRAEALAEAEQADRHREADALEAVGPRIEALLQQAETHQQVLERQVVRFALSVFEKIIPELMDSRGTIRAENEVRAALAIALGSASVRVFLPSQVAAAHGLALEEAAQRLGHAGRVEVMGDIALAPGEARVEWDNGFMEYSYGVICNRILTALRAASALPDAVPEEPETESEERSDDGE
ncbi:hypothetical protein E0K89_013455 [Aquicoccus sp. SCR17]|nr:hypothetical protein [Carideicomes alvinocaridis]